MAAKALDLSTIQINQAQLTYTGYQDPGYEGMSFARWEQQGVLAYAWLEEVEHGQRPHRVFLDGSARVLTLTYDRVAHMGTLGPRQEDLGQEMVDLFRPYLVKELLANGWRVIYKTKAGRDIWLPGRYLQHHPSLKPVTPNGMEEAIGPEVVENDQSDLAIAGAGAEVPSEDQVREVEQADQDQDDQLDLDLEGQPEPRHSHIVEVVGSAEAKERGQPSAYSREVFTREVTFTCIVCETTVTQQRYPGHTPLYCSDSCKRERQRAKTRERVARHRENQKSESST